VSLSSKFRYAEHIQVSNIIHKIEKKKKKQKKNKLKKITTGIGGARSVPVLGRSQIHL
jgi:hypothetical protein